MIKAAGSGHGGPPVLVLGLDDANWSRLRRGQPIRVEAEDMGLAPLTIILTGGRTELDLYEQVEPFIGPRTRVVMPEDGLRD